MAVDRASVDSLAPYRATVRARSERDARARAARRERALRRTRWAAELLTREHGASRVVLFGSLAHGRWFSDASDIDLAAWGSHWAGQRTPIPAVGASLPLKR